MTLSVEAQGREWARGYFESRKRGLNDLVMVVERENAWIMELPPLMGDNFALRLDSVGGIHSISWRERDPRIIERNSQDFQLLYPHPRKQTPEEYLQHIPQFREKAMVWSPAIFTSIESAIRGQRHVMDRVIGPGEGSDFWQAEQVIGAVDELAEKVLGNGLNPNNLSLLSQGVEELLVRANLTEVQAGRKVQMMEKLRGAFTRDSLGRINPLVTRIRLRSAFINAVRQLVFSSRVANKYTANETQLKYEQGFTRWALGEASDLLERKLQAHAGFRKQGEESYSQRRILERIMVEEISHGLLTIPRVKPYLAAARLAGIALIGCQPEYLETNRLIIDDESKLAWLISQDSVTQMVAGNRFPEADKRVEEIRAVIDNVLQ
ncbi:hypothetical protein KKE48_02445 [Patescibacteria group bacterium]|nr:hypothetical protein [Patescibacteria group bacterium]